jgi:hypothetical protein
MHELITDRPLRRLCILLLGLGVVAPAAADPGYYVLTPYSVAGQFALDLRYWTVKSSDGRATLWPELGLRYGFSSRWASEILASYIGDSLREQNLSSLNWQNSYLLTQGQYPFDVAIHAQLIRNRGKDNALELGPLLQTEVGLTQLNFNLVFEHVSNNGTQLKYQWQVQQRLQPGLRLGVQGFGELGPWDHWSDRQSHRAGHRSCPTGGRPAVRACRRDPNAAPGRRGSMFSAQLLLPF